MLISGQGCSTHFIHPLFKLSLLYLQNHLQHHTSIARDKDESKPNMYYLRNYVSLPSSVLHSWLYRLLKLGYRKPLTIEDLGCLPEEHLVTPNHQRFNKALHEEMVRNKA